MRVVVAVLSIAGLLVAASLIYTFWTRQFSLANIAFASDYPTQITFSKPEVATIRGILAQPFTYLDRGKQSYVFLSQDKQVVLKFFDALQFQSTHLSESRLQRRYHRLFGGHELAYVTNRKNTRILCAKLKEDPVFDFPVELIDRFGRKQSLSLKTVPFILQKAAVPTGVRLSQLLDQGNLEQAKLCLRKIIDLYLDEYKMGLSDKDRNFMHNTGFVRENVVRIDVGRLRYRERNKNRERMIHSVKRVMGVRSSKWLERYYPLYTQELMDDMRCHFEAIGTQK
jgi:hypothetical protein